MKSLITLSTALIFTALSSVALADIELKTISELEITEVNDKGEKTVKRVPVKTVIPGSIVVYTITAKSDARSDDQAVLTLDFDAKDQRGETVQAGQNRLLAYR